MKHLKIIGISCLLMLISSIGHTQNQIYQLEEVLQLPTANAGSSDAYDLNALAYDLVPTIYYKNGKATITDKLATPVRVIVDATAIGKLYEVKPSFKTIEMIVIQLSDVSELTSTINVELLQHFTQLRYVYISCSFNVCDTDVCAKEKISSMLQGKLPATTSLIYSSAINE